MDKRKKEIARMRQEAIDDLKNGIEESLLEEFVEHHELWKGKMGDVNSIIEHVAPEIPLYTFNEFCKQIIGITKESLNSGFDYDKVFLTKEEYMSLLQESSGSKKELHKAMEKELQKKVVRNLMNVLNATQIKESVKYKLQDQFVHVEQALDKSLEIATAILIKYEEENIYL